MNQAMTDLFVKLQQLSPHIWDVLLRQVKIDTWSDTIIAVVGAVSAATCAKIGHRAWTRYKALDAREEPRSSHDIVALGALLGVVFFTAFAVAATTAAITRTLNPDYYAIRLLLDKQ